MTFRIHNIARFAATIGVLTLFWGLSYMPPASALPPEARLQSTLLVHLPVSHPIP